MHDVFVEIAMGAVLLGVGTALIAIAIRAQRSRHQSVLGTWTPIEVQVLDIEKRRVGGGDASATVVFAKVQLESGATQDVRIPRRLARSGEPVETLHLYQHPDTPGRILHPDQWFRGPSFLAIFGATALFMGAVVMAVMLTGAPGDDESAATTVEEAPSESDAIQTAHQSVLDLVERVCADGEMSHRDETRLAQALIHYGSTAGLPPDDESLKTFGRGLLVVACNLTMSEATESVP